MATANRRKCNPVNTQTFMAGGTTVKGAVAHLSSGTVIVADANAVENIGIFLEAVDSGSPVSVALEGSVCDGLAYDSSIVEGDDLVANSGAGRLDTAGALTAGHTYVVAKALDGSDAAGQLIPVMVTTYTRPDSAA